MNFYSLHIGLNAVDAGHYQGWDGRLNACEADALSMQQLVLSLADAPHIKPPTAYQTTLLLTKQATRATVLEALAKYARLCKPGDFFLLTYSGHGGQLPDQDGDEADNMDETWVLYDAQLVDDELYLAYSEFAEGVRILVLSDSCHSGSVLRAAYQELHPTTDPLGDNAVNYQRGYDQGRVVVGSHRDMPLMVVQQTFNANRQYYEKILRDLMAAASTGTGRKAQQRPVKASVRLLSGCADNQYSQDGIFNGLFTGVLLRVWNGGAFRGDYHAFHKAILARMPPSQSPQHAVMGTVDPLYDRMTPFTAMPAKYPPRHHDTITKVAALPDAAR
jgi:hypothetical protein